MLKIDSKLAWSVFKVAMASEPLAAGVYVPRAAAMEKVLKAAISRGVPAQVVQRAEEAFSSFEELVTRHAGDRTSFEAMITGVSGESKESIDLANKRATFRGNTQLWGVHLRTGLNCHVVQPGTRPGSLDTIQVRGWVGLRQLRWSKTMRAAMGTRHRDVLGMPENGPLEPEEVLAPSSFSLLRRFSVEPLPEFRAVADSTGFGRVEILSRGVGNTAAFTFFCAMVSRNSHSFPIGHPYPQGPCWRTLITLPTETRIEDILVHKDAWSGPPPRVGVYGTQATNPNAIANIVEREEDLLPVQESITELGLGADALDDPEVPDYPEMMRYVLGKAGWDHSQFRVFRCRIEYPILFSLLRIEFPSQQGRGDGSQPGK